MKDSHHFPRLVAGACMVAAPVFVLASAIVSPKLSTDGLQQLRYIADHLDRWYATQVLALVGLVLLVPAILGLMHMLRERQATAGYVGGGLALIGVMAATATTGTAFVFWQMAKAGLDNGQIATLAERVFDSNGIIVALFLPTALVAIGFAVLAYGLWRAQAVHPASALLVAAGAICLDIGFGFAGSITLGIVGSAIFLVGLLPIGWAVLMETDEDWEHTPTFRGFRAATGTH